MPTEESSVAGPALPAEFDVEVRWGLQALTVHMQEMKLDGASRPSRMRWWFGDAGLVQIKQSLTVKGTPMAQARIDYPDVLDVLDGYDHDLSSEWHDDIPTAVADLYAKVEEVRRWADDVLAGKKGDEGDD